MPLRDTRTRAGLFGGKHRTAGQLNVTYRNAAGKTMQAIVVGQGTVSGLKLRIRNRLTVLVIDNVAKATTDHSNNAYYDRGTLGGLG